MIHLTASTPILFATDAADFRKGIDGFVAICSQQLHQDPRSGSLYVFINRKGDQMKILFFDRNGYSIWGKRLEQGRFVTHDSSEKKATLSYTQLQCLLDGIEWRGAKQYKRFSRSQQRAERL